MHISTQPYRCHLFLCINSGKLEMCCCFSHVDCCTICSIVCFITSCTFPSVTVILWISDFRFCTTSMPQSHTYKLQQLPWHRFKCSLSFLLTPCDNSAAGKTQRQRRQAGDGGRLDKLSKQGHWRLSHTDTYVFSFASCQLKSRTAFL